MTSVLLAAADFKHQNLGQRPPPTVKVFSSLRRSFGPTEWGPRFEVRPVFRHEDGYFDWKISQYDLNGQPWRVSDFRLRSFDNLPLLRFAADSALRLWIPDDQEWVREGPPVTKMTIAVLVDSELKAELTVRQQQSSWLLTGWSSPENCAAELSAPGRVLFADEEMAVIQVLERATYCLADGRTKLQQRTAPLPSFWVPTKSIPPESDRLYGHMGHRWGSQLDSD